MKSVSWTRTDTLERALHTSTSRPIESRSWEGTDDGAPAAPQSRHKEDVQCRELHSAPLKCGFASGPSTLSQRSVVRVVLSMGPVRRPTELFLRFPHWE